MIALGGLPPALAAKAATTTIPIVFQLGVDPVAAGLVASLARPGGNLTGVSNLNAELGPKRLELLRELVPTAKVFGLLVNPTNPGAETHREGRAGGGRHPRNCSSMSCMPARSATSMRCLQTWSDCAQAGS